MTFEQMFDFTILNKNNCQYKGYVKKELTGSQYISYLNISVNSRFLFFKCNFR